MCCDIMLVGKCFFPGEVRIEFVVYKIYKVIGDRCQKFVD